SGRGPRKKHRVSNFHKNREFGWYLKLFKVIDGNKDYPVWRNLYGRWGLAMAAHIQMPINSTGNKHQKIEYETRVQVDDDVYVPGSPSKGNSRLYSEDLRS
ncbi:hypothetical protein KI387_003132, partial [Taxus chinensis]